MERPQIDLAKIKEKNAQKVVARLEGEIDDKAARLWGEEFAASGGGKSPPPPPPSAPQKE